MREDQERRVEWLEAMILLYERKLKRGVYNPSHFIRVIKIYREEIEKLLNN